MAGPVELVQICGLLTWKLIEVKLHIAESNDCEHKHKLPQYWTIHCAVALHHAYGIGSRTQSGHHLCCYI